MRRIGEKNHKQQLREKAIEYLGGQCVHCLAEGVINTDTLEFDHIDPFTKINNVTRLLSHSFTSSKFWEEVEKCQLLCSFHHKTKTASEGSRFIFNKPIGILNASAKLRDLDVKYIRRLHVMGHSQKAIAEEFGVHRSTVYLIIANKTWTHVL